VKFPDLILLHLEPHCCLRYYPVAVPSALLSSHPRGQVADVSYPGYASLRTEHEVMCLQVLPAVGRCAT